MRNGLRLSLFFTACSLMLSLNFKARAQGNIYTDRPTQTTSSAVVPVGSFQIETGFYLLQYDISAGGVGGTDKFQYFSLNNTLLRYGLSDRVELRFSQEISKSRFMNDGAVTFSNPATFAPTMIGAKFNIFKNSPDFPDLGIITSFGGGIFEETGSGLQSDIRVALDAPIGESLTLSTNLGSGFSNGFDSAVPFYTLNFGYGVNDKVGVFIESYGSFPGGGSSDHAMDAGFTYLVNSSLQLDVYGGTGFSSSAANLLIGFGLSKRFLK